MAVRWGHLTKALGENTVVDGGDDDGLLGIDAPKNCAGAVVNLEPMNRGRLFKVGDVMKPERAGGLEDAVADEEDDDEDRQEEEDEECALLHDISMEPANRGRQWRAQRSCASPLHAGLGVRVDAAMAPARSRNRGHATSAPVVFAGNGEDGGLPRRR